MTVRVRGTRRAVDDRQMNAAEDVPQLLRQAHGNVTGTPNHGDISIMSEESMTMRSLEFPMNLNNLSSAWDLTDIQLNLIRFPDVQKYPLGGIP